MTIKLEPGAEGKFTKYYRVGAANAFRSTAAPLGLFRRIQAADGAERQIRAQLRVGYRPEVALITSEQASLAQIEKGGVVAGVYAFAPGPADGPVRSDWARRHHVVAELDVARHEPDRMSAEYAADGSVKVLAGRIRRLVVAQWVAPLASELSERYGVPVEVSAEPELPEAKVLPNHTTAFWRDALPAEILDDLVDHFRRTGEITSFNDGYTPSRPHAALPWEIFGDLISALLGEVAAVYGLPVNYASASVMSYSAGDLFRQHIDRVSDVPGSWDRTVSFSLLLNEPGVDFTGGELEVEGHVIDLRRGDLAGFTARTLHAVRRITSGERLVLCAFGEYHR